MTSLDAPVLAATRKTGTDRDGGSVGGLVGLGLGRQFEMMAA